MQRALVTGGTRALTVELVERAASGDRAAFDVLVAGALDRLYGVARLIVHDSDAAEDAVQEALVKCWRELPRLRNAAKFDAWLHRLLINAATDHHRRGRALRVAVGKLPRGDVQPDFASGVVAADEIRAAFGGLRIEHRVVLVLHHYLGLTPAEIADTVGVPAGTARSRLHYASEAMRAALDARDRAGAALASPRGRR